jgi:hypothetical protein
VVPGVSEESDHYTFLVLDDHRSQIRQEHGEEALNSFESKLEKKRQQLQWITDVSQLSKRFWRVVGSDGVTFPEMWFAAQSNNFRAIFVAVPSAKKLVFRDSLKKDEGHGRLKQSQLLQSLRKNSRRELEKAEDLVLEHCF